MRVSTAIPLAPADPLDDAFLEEAQQLDLERQRDVAHLIEEQRPALRQFDLADVRLDRAGERAALVAEQLGLEQVLGDGGAIDRDELALAPALLVHGPGEQLLAGAASPQEHHGHVGGRHALDGLGDLQHLRRGADDRSEHGLVRASLEPPVLFLDLVEVERARDDHPELVDVDRLLVKVVGAHADGLECTFAGAVPGCDDDLGVGLEAKDFR